MGSEGCHSNMGDGLDLNLPGPRPELSILTIKQVCYNNQNENRTCGWKVTEVGRLVGVCMLTS